MILSAILIATLAAGIGSVWIAAILLRLGMARGTDDAPQYLLSLAAGALLATAFMHLLPEAFESAVEPSALFGVLLLGLVLFFLLDKAELWHHGHEHHHGHGHGATHAHGHDEPRIGGWTLLIGDSVHFFGDGILIASAFLANWRLGVVSALAVSVHEVPHHIGDLVVLRQTSPDARAAMIKISLASTVTALGGLVGWWLVGRVQGLLPYCLVLAGSSFIYVALADLIPQLQRRLSARQTFGQIAWLAAGIVLVTVVSRLAHGGHDHAHEHGAMHERIHGATLQD